jgi:hypothetical protein
MLANKKQGRDKTKGWDEKMREFMTMILKKGFGFEESRGSSKRALKETN